MNMQAVHIKLLHRHTVMPAIPTPPHSFFLTCFDIMWRHVHYNRRLLFYDRPSRDSLLHHGGDNDEVNITSVSQHLRNSLSDCLVHYYCWCGRIAKAVEPPHRLFIECNDAGVEFLENSIDMPLSQLARDGFQMKPFFDQLCQEPDYKGGSLFSSPLLSIQATFFSDGGLALGVAQSHVVADGQSLWDFMVSWGECSRGVNISQFPVHDRQMLALPNPSLEKLNTLRANLDDYEDDDEEKALSTDSKGGHVDKDHSTIGDCDGCTVATSAFEENSNSLVQCMFNLSASAINKLKQEAAGSYTTFEVTCAHFWKQMTLARKSPPRQPTHLFIPVNCRSRIRPPLSPAFFGNAICCGKVSSKVGNFVKEHLSSTASRIHSSIVDVKEDRIVAMMHWLEHDNNCLDTARNSVPEGNIKGHHQQVASSPRFPAYQVDFGLGKPIAVRAVKVTDDGELVFFGGNPTSSQGDVEICTALPGGVLRRLLEDPNFLAKIPSSPFALL